jgi:hypothetical protein
MDLSMLLGGRTGEDIYMAAPLHSNEMYDPATDKWTIKASMPTDELNFACSLKA